jgi:DnaK suppressor protein
MPPKELTHFRTVLEARQTELEALLIQRGTFGICLDCEEEISMKRIAAVPWATACLACRAAGESRAMPTANVSGEAVSSLA